MYLCKPAAMAWDEYVKCKEEIEAIYKKYDTDNSHSLDRFFLFFFFSFFFLLFPPFSWKVLVQFLVLVIHDLQEVRRVWWNSSDCIYIDVCIYDSCMIHTGCISYALHQNIFWCMHTRVFYLSFMCLQKHIGKQITLPRDSDTNPSLSTQTNVYVEPSLVYLLENL